MYRQITELIKTAGEIVLSASDIQAEISEKNGDANFVTAYDVKVQECLIEGLSKILPQANFFAEESGSAVPDMNEYTFIIDPIDGTTNFIKGFDHSAISVALVKDCEVIFGVVYNPYKNKMYTALKGQGAFLNGRAVKMGNGSISEGIVSFGTTPYNRKTAHETLGLAELFLEKSMDIRRSGSAVLDLCDVACGCSNLFFELQLQPWDYAAASLIVREAGGTVTTMENTPVTLNKPCSVLAGTENAHREALELIK
ncbi:MAG: inositol monophosphatase [Clostridia bacterium]|nr:inositol monophosphatase [Clostridia bacterium]